MRLSPLDIKKQEFSRQLRGYEVEEVQAFLQMIARQWEEMQEQQRYLEDRVRQFEAKLEHYEKVEVALEEALRTARENASKTQEHAQRQADLVLREAEVKAQQIVADAEQKRKQLTHDIAKLSNRRGDISARLRAFLMSELELLAHFDGDDPVGFIKLFPSRDQPRPVRVEEALLPEDEPEQTPRDADSLHAETGEAAPEEPEQTAPTWAAQPAGLDEAAQPPEPDEPEEPIILSKPVVSASLTTSSEPAAPRAPEPAAPRAPEPAKSLAPESAHNVARIRRILDDLD